MPLVLYQKDAGWESGKRAQLISLIDVMPTLYSLCGGADWMQAQGVDCSAAVKRRDGGTQQSVYYYSIVPCHQAMFRRPGSWRAIRTEQYLYCTDHRGRGVALYGADDELQQNNRIGAAQDAGLRAQLKRGLDVCVRENDGYAPWRTLLRRRGLLAEWNRSQRYFARLYLGFLRRKKPERAAGTSQKKAKP